MRYLLAVVFSLLTCCAIVAHPYTNELNNVKELHKKALEAHADNKNDVALLQTLKALGVMDSLQLNNTSLYAECLHDAGMFSMLGDKDLDTFTYYMQRAVLLKNELLGNNDDYYWSVQCYADGLLHYSKEIGFPKNIELLEASIDNYKQIPNYQSCSSFYVALKCLADAYQNVNLIKSIEYSQEYLDFSRLYQFATDTLPIISKLGYYYKEIGEFEKSKCCLDLVINACEASGSNGSLLRDSYITKASLNGRMGEFESAFKYSEKARNIEDLIEGRGSSLYATILMNSGTYLLANDSIHMALSYLSEAYNHPNSNKENVAFNLASAYCKLKDPDSCYYYINESWQLYQDELLNNLYNMSVDNRLHYLVSGMVYYKMRSPFNFLRSFMDDPGLLKLSYDCSVFCKEVVSQYLKIDNQFDKHSVILNYDSISQYLDENEVVIEMLSYPLLHDNEEGIYAFLMKKNWDYPKLVTLNVGLISDALYNEVQANDNYLPLYETIWKDIIVAGGLMDNDRIFISCDGILSQIPIEWISDYELMYLGDRYDIIRVSSSQNILKQKRNKELKSVVLYGGLDYDKKPNDEFSIAKSESYPVWDNLTMVFGDSITSEFRSSIEYLPWSLTEIETISNTIKSNSDQIDLVVLDGQNGTEKSFKSLSGTSPSIIHIATHGFSPNAQLSMDWFDYYYFCMNNSGLLLSGGTYSSDSTVSSTLIEDGVLTSTEIAMLDLRNTELVVLSACNTGLTGLTPYGLIGLQKAFKVAGAGTIIMTLEKVDDAATCFFMSSFYNSLVNGYNKRQAFKNAINAMRNDERFNSFNYWAWFVMID